MSESKKEKKELDQIVKSNGHLQISRRQFMGNASLGTIGYVAMPSFLNLLTQSATAAECGLSNVVNNDRVVFMIFDLAGGPSINAALLPGTVEGDKESFRNAGGNMAKRGAAISTVTSGNEVNLTRAFGGTMWALHPFTQSLMAATSEKAKLSTDFFVINSVTDDDYSGILDDRVSAHSSPANMLAQVAPAGRIFKGVGTFANLSGTYQAAPSGSRKGAYSFVKVSSPTDIQNALKSGALVANLGATKASQVWDSLKNLNNSQVDFLNGRSLASESKDIIECMNVGGKSINLDFNVTSPTVFPSTTTDTDLAQVFSNFNTNNFEKQLGTMAHLLANGNASGAAIAVAGGDYHTLGQAYIENYDRTAGDAIGKTIEYFTRKNIKAFIVTIQDGGIVTDFSALNGTTGRTNPAGDDLSGTIHSVWVVNPTSPIVTATSSQTRTLASKSALLADATTQSRQIGMITTGADVNGNGAGGLGRSATMSAQAIVANYLVAAGIDPTPHGAMLNLLGADPTKISSTYIKLKKMV